MTQHHELVRRVMTADEDLDDIKRARIWTQLEDRLAEPAARRVRWPVFAAIAAAAAAAILVIATRSSERAPETIVVAAESTLTWRLGPHANAALVGPARLELIGTPAAASTVKLRTGTLLAEFDGGAGRALRIETPHATVEVVGTLFAVVVRDDTTCAAVAHGRVRVTATETVLVGAGERFCTGERVQPIDEPTQRQLERHQTPVIAQAPAPPPATPAEASPQLEPAPAPPAPVIPAVIPAEAPRAPRRASPPAPSTTAPEPAEPPAPVEPAPLTESAALAPEPAPPPEPPPPPAIAPPKPTADELYRAAERALVARDLDVADRALGRVLSEYPASQLVDQALYDRARIAYERRAWSAARKHLERLAAIASSPLAEPGHYLGCRIAVETRDDRAAQCLADFRKAYPRSAHDPDVLAVLVKLAHTRGGCRAAAPALAELVAKYPRASALPAWRQRCPEEGK